MRLVEVMVNMGTIQTETSKSKKIYKISCNGLQGFKKYGFYGFWKGNKGYQIFLLSNMCTLDCKTESFLIATDG